MNGEEFIITEDQAGERADKLLSRLVSGSSRTEIKKWIEDGDITVNRKTIKANFKISAGDRVLVNRPEPEELTAEPENIPLDIVYEDHDILVVNKPKGMVVHPAPGHPSHTLVNALLYHCNDLSGINGVLRPGIVHRLDKDTSGLMVVAKNDGAHRKLAEDLKDKKIKRTYQAIVHGIIEPPAGKIDAPIGRDEKDRKKMAVTAKNSKEAVTHFTVLERFDDYTHVTCQLETGRTHQIRVHMAYIGHPVAGDPKYGPKKTPDLDGQALHASELRLIHPLTGEEKVFEASLPDVFNSFLTSLKKD